MTCTRCSREIELDSTFCRFCGAAVRPVPGFDPPARRLYRSIADRRIAGVCGGLAEYFRMDPTLVRLLVVILSIYPGAVIFGLLAYGIAWAIIPPGPVPPPLSTAPSAASTA